MPLTRVEKFLVAAFGERTAMAASDLLGTASAGESSNLVRDAYGSLQAKGVLAVDALGIASLDRRTAERLTQEPQRYEPLDVGE